MGGCASKPKVLREEYDAPLPLPPAAEEDAVKQEEEVTKDVVVVEEANADEVNNVASVADLSTPDEQQSSEQVKEEIFETEEASEGSKSNPQEHEIPIEEQTSALMVDSHSPAESEPERAQEAASMAEASEPPLTPCVEKTIEEVKEVKEVPCMDEQKQERETGDDLDSAEDNTPKPEKETEEGLTIALDHAPEPEDNNTEEVFDIAEDNKTSKPETPLEDKIEEKQIIADEKPHEMKTEEEEEEVEAPVTSTSTATEESKKPSNSKKQYWPIAALLKNPLGNFAKAK